MIFVTKALAGLAKRQSLKKSSATAARQSSCLRFHVERDLRYVDSHVDVPKDAAIPKYLIHVILTAKAVPNAPSLWNDDVCVASAWSKTNNVGWSISVAVRFVGRNSAADTTSVGSLAIAPASARTPMVKLASSPAARRRRFVDIQMRHLAMLLIHARRISLAPARCSSLAGARLRSRKYDVVHQRVAKATPPGHFHAMTNALGWRGTANLQWHSISINPLT
jgi:hypothetical protein